LVIEVEALFLSDGLKKRRQVVVVGLILKLQTSAILLVELKFMRAVLTKFYQ
jgi:hypothetical protein